jgi:hypothetical protein
VASAQVPPAVWLPVAQRRAVAEQRVGQVLALAQPVRAPVPEQAAASRPPERASPLVAKVTARVVQASVSPHRPIVVGSPAPVPVSLRVAAAVRRAEPASRLAWLVAAVAAAAAVAQVPVAPRRGLRVLAPASPPLAALAHEWVLKAAQEQTSTDLLPTVSRLEWRFFGRARTNQQRRGPQGMQ